MDLLSKLPAWWKEVLASNFKDVNGMHRPLLLAVRNGYLNAYVEGQSVLKIKFDNARRPTRLQARIHHKFLGDAVGQKLVVFDGSAIDGAPFLPGNSLPYWISRAQGYARMKGGGKTLSEKQGTAIIAACNPHVIDVEMGLPGVTAAQIDIVALERAGSAINIVFYEAKLFHNPDLKADNLQPKVLRQLDKYEAWLTSNDRAGEVVRAYREACKVLVALREMQNVSIDDLVVEASQDDSNLMIDPRPRLVVFGFKESELGHCWERHRAALRCAGLDHSRLIMQPNPKDVRLSRGTFPEGYIDEAEDILASCEGMEFVEKMNASMRHNKLSAIARFAPIFTEPGFRFATRHEQAAKGPGEAAVLRFHLLEDAYRFIEAAYDAGWVEFTDWRTWSTSKEAQDLNRNPARIAQASEGQLGKLLTAHIRNDRFDKGALNAAFEGGVLTAIVQRAKVLLHG